MSANDKAAATYGPGRTTPPLEARIAAVLAGHKAVRLEGLERRDPIATCKCGVEVPGGPEGLRSHQAAMLAPVIAEVQAEAWDMGQSACDREWFEITSGVSARDMGSAHETPNPYRSTP